MSYIGGKFYYFVLQSIMSSLFSLFLLDETQVLTETELFSAFMSCMDESLLTYSAFVLHIHRKLQGLLREER